MEEFHYEEVQLSEMTLEDGVLRFPCPCGDLFELLLEDFIAGNDVAQCPTCSLTVKVLFTPEEKRHFLAQSSAGAVCAVAA
ncbi:CSL zinc finger containing protein [Novymonas esmeraldas]|uniref:CSL zinc finger containing protein n=1 Tax=Novymonas esmeraldas TaxID=1808958 RepID=A0AAW0EV85_9TRYP